MCNKISNTNLKNEITLKRRKFLKKILVFIFSVELILLIFGSIGRKKAQSEKKKLFKVGEINSFSCGETYFFQSGQFFLRRYEDGGFLAISIKCTHLACAISKQNGNFICPCHNSKFNEYGELIASPATRPLDIFKITENDNLLYVDISKPIKRAKFEHTQISYF